MLRRRLLVGVDAYRRKVASETRLEVSAFSRRQGNAASRNPRRSAIGTGGGRGACRLALHSKVFLGFASGAFSLNASCSTAADRVDRPLRHDLIRNAVRFVLKRIVDRAKAHLALNRRLPGHDGRTGSGVLQTDLHRLPQNSGVTARGEFSIDANVGILSRGRWITLIAMAKPFP